MQSRVTNGASADGAGGGSKPDPTPAQTLGQPKGKPLVGIDSTIFKDVQVALHAKLGRASLSIEELLGLKAGSVVKLDLKVNDLVELHLNDSVVARGEIVAVGDQFGIRIVEVGRIS